MGLVAEDDWPATSLVVRDVALWLYAYPHVFGIVIATVVAVFWVLIHAWTGPGRAAARQDRAVFSLYRVIVGSAFTFVLLEYLRAGLDLNDRTFEELKRSASPYTRHRIGAIQSLMAQGKGLGASMIATGHGFPDPKLLRIVESLDGVPGWENKIQSLRQPVGSALGSADESARERAFQRSLPAGGRGGRRGDPDDVHHAGCGGQDGRGRGDRSLEQRRWRWCQ